MLEVALTAGWLLTGFLGFLGIQYIEKQDITYGNIWISFIFGPITIIILVVVFFIYNNNKPLISFRQRK